MKVAVMQSYSDPVHRELANAFAAAGIEYEFDVEFGDDRVCFLLTKYNIGIDCMGKASTKNVITIRSYEAAKAFAEMIVR